MGFNPLDPSDPRGFVTYMIVTGDDTGAHNRGPQQQSGCGCFTLVIAAIFLVWFVSFCR